MSHNQPTIIVNDIINYACCDCPSGVQQSTLTRVKQKYGVYQLKQPLCCRGVESYKEETPAGQKETPASQEKIPTSQRETLATNEKTPASQEKTPACPEEIQPAKKGDFSPLIALLCDEGWEASDLISQLPAVSRNGSFCCLH